jgi:opacity protein-like surface antigen
MQSTKYLGTAVATIAGLMTALPSPAQQRTMPSAPGAYFGAGAGVGYMSFKGSDFDNVASGLNSAGLGGGGLSQTTNRDTTDFAGKVFGGYRFNQYIGIEGSYVGFSTLDYNYQFQQAGLPAGSGNMSYKAWSWNVAAVPRFPLHQGLFVQGKLGAAFTTAENSINLTAGTFSQQSTEKKNRTNLLAGAGLGYDFPNGLSIIGEYEYYGQVGSAFNYNASGMSGTGRADMNLFTVSGMIRF